MSWDLIALHAVAAVAAFFQSVTGIGFGMIAGPVILVVLAEPQAVIVSTLMSWLIGLVLFPMLYRGADWRLALRLLASAAVVLPLGLWVLSIADIATLKLISGVSIGALTAMMVLGAPGMRTPGRAGDAAFGGLAGLFGGCLAMPGPTAVLRATGLGLAKARTRATMVVFFAMVWPLIFLGQWASIGISQQTLIHGASLIPATLTGLAIGNWAAGRVSEVFFRRLVILVLLATAVALLLDAIL